ncbi:protein of unknown function [Burkholderia multivorans]
MKINFASYHNNSHCESILRNYPAIIDPPPRSRVRAARIPIRGLPGGRSTLAFAHRDDATTHRGSACRMTESWKRPARLTGYARFAEKIPGYPAPAIFSRHVPDKAGHNARLIFESRGIRMKAQHGRSGRIPRAR